MSLDTMTTTEIIDRDAKYTSGVYKKTPVALVRGEGVRVWDADRNEYIDCTAGVGVAGVGHANPAVARAISDQVNRLITVAEGYFYNDVRAQLLEKLAEITPDPLQRSFLTNSGTEAIEAAIKFARGTTRRSNIIATMRAFHGRTLGALSATWKRKYRKPFEPLVPGFHHVPYGDLDRLEDAVRDGDGAAAVILEAVQGEGGVYLAPEGYLKGAREICDRHQALLVIDEIQTGFGRTGRMFAIEHVGITPDILTVAKAMGGGVPIGAAIMRDGIELEPGLHGSTFGGNPLACRAALATIQYIEEHHLVEKAAEHGRYFLEQLKRFERLDHVREARGLGLMLGLQLREKVGKYLTALRERGVLALIAGNTVIRFLPPLIITKDEIDRVVETLWEVLER
ncbi:MAG: aspartate aminotransferase family protein [Candidatus Bipolaricaulia bacterium]